MALAAHGIFSCGMFRMIPYISDHPYKITRGLYDLHDYFSGFAPFFVQETPFPLDMGGIFKIR